MDLSRFQSLDVVLVCGLPGSGKSHFAKTYFNRNDRKRINRKEIRRFLYEMTSFGDPWKEAYFNDHDEMLVKHVERKILEHLLQNKKKILIDNTSVTVDSRKSYVAIARQMNKSIGMVFLNTPLQKCHARNQHREDPLIATIISNLYAGLKLPEKSEGYNELLILSDY